MTKTLSISRVSRTVTVLWDGDRLQYSMASSGQFPPNITRYVCSSVVTRWEAYERQPVLLSDSHHMINTNCMAEESELSIESG